MKDIKKNFFELVNELYNHKEVVLERVKTFIKNREEQIVKLNQQYNVTAPEQDVEIDVDELVSDPQE